RTPAAGTEALYDASASCISGPPTLWERALRPTRTPRSVQPSVAPLLPGALGRSACSGDRLSRRAALLRITWPASSLRRPQPVLLYVLGGKKPRQILSLRLQQIFGQCPGHGRIGDRAICQQCLDHQPTAARECCLHGEIDGSELAPDNAG